MADKIVCKEGFFGIKGYVSKAPYTFKCLEELLANRPPPLSVEEMLNRSSMGEQGIKNFNQLMKDHEQRIQ